MTNSHQSFIVGGYLNQWFATYAEAKDQLKTNGGYLFPYQNQFFICQADYLQQIGFAPEDPNWEQIGYDWVNPDNQEAWQRLNKNRV